MDVDDDVFGSQRNATPLQPLQSPPPSQPLWPSTPTQFVTPQSSTPTQLAIPQPLTPTQLATPLQLAGCSFYSCKIRSFSDFVFENIHSFCFSP